ELYNLEKDLGENHNLFESNSELAAQLAETLTQHLISVQAQMPIVKTTKQIVPWPNAIFKRTK
ncbi:MAG TPA: sulfatase, partial [Flavobacteriaceae bacterium]|nr:sulfatase [Flavobacteriaceae bacterium]